MPNIYIFFGYINTISAANINLYIYYYRGNIFFFFSFFFSEIFFWNSLRRDL